MKFSVIIPVKNLSYYLLFESIPALANQIYKNFEVIVLPNEHNQYDLTLLKTYKWLRIIPTGRVTRPAEKRNIGVKNAKGEIIAFIDDDAYPTKNWLEEAAKCFKKKVLAICGPGILPSRSDRWERIFDQVLTTWIGSGEYSYRFLKQHERYVDDYPSMNFFIYKKTFQKLGGFKGNYWPGEDSKLCEDLIYKEKGKILYSPRVVVYHHRRKDLKGYLKQHANYGFHRGAFFAHGDRNSRRFSYLIPTLFFFYLLFIILYSLLIIFELRITNYEFLSFSLYLPSILYFFSLIYLFFLSLLNTKNFLIAFGSVIVLILTHFTYGIMFVKGLIKGYFSKENIYG